MPTIKEKKSKLVQVLNFRHTADGGRRVIRLARVYSDGSSDERTYSYGVRDPIPYEGEPAFLYILPNGTKKHAETMASAQLECFRHFFSETW